VEVDDGLLFLVLKPQVTRDVTIVLVDFAITSSLIVELALSDPQPCHEGVTWKLGTLGPAARVIDNSIASIAGGPNATQSPPSTFLS
jgi:hypothetical protein